jgi:hypothetical protein
MNFAVIKYFNFTVFSEVVTYLPPTLDKIVNKWILFASGGERGSMITPFNSENDSSSVVVSMDDDDDDNVNNNDSSSSSSSASGGPLDVGDNLADSSDVRRRSFDRTRMGNGRSGGGGGGGGGGKQVNDDGIELKSNSGKVPSTPTKQVQTSSFSKASELGASEPERET